MLVLMYVSFLRYDHTYRQVGIQVYILLCGTPKYFKM